MRTLVLLVVSFLTISVYGQNSQYLDAVKASKQKMDSAKTSAEWLNIANQFERIAGAEPTHWEPHYHAAFCQVMAAFMEKGEKIDAIADQADANIDKATGIAPNESEIYVLKAMIFQARISVSPMNRGREYSEKAAVELGKAEKLNADNPRIYFTKGQSTLYTPKFFGGGPKKAKPLFEQAKTLFDKFVPKDEVSPNWGKKLNEEMIKKCD